MKEEHGGEDNHDHAHHHGVYLEQLFFTYRKMMMHVCSVVLIFQVYLTAAHYETYKPIKDEADKMKNEFFAK